MILALILTVASSVGGATVLHPAPAGSPQEVPKTEDAALRARLLALLDESEEAYTKWEAAFSKVYEAWQKAVESGSEEPLDPPKSPMPAFFERFDALATSGFPEAQLWCLQNYHADVPAEGRAKDIKARALAVLKVQGADHVTLANVVASHFRQELLSKNVAANLLMLIEANATDPEARATAAYRSAGLPPPDGLSEERLEERRLNALRGIVEMYGSTTVGKRAAGEIFAMENLQIGMVAPEIEGTDVDGNPMKLSDFRGKVVVLDFWGFW
jgi:hypothetical protein